MSLTLRLVHTNTKLSEIPFCFFFVVSPDFSAFFVWRGASAENALKKYELIYCWKQQYYRSLNAVRKFDYNSINLKCNFSPCHIDDVIANDFLIANTRAKLLKILNEPKVLRFEIWTQVDWPLNNYTDGIWHHCNVKVYTFIWKEKLRKIIHKLWSILKEQRIVRASFGSFTTVKYCILPNWWTQIIKNRKLWTSTNGTAT